MIKGFLDGNSNDNVHGNNNPGGSIYSVNWCAVGERNVNWSSKWRF